MNDYREMVRLLQTISGQLTDLQVFLGSYLEPILFTIVFFCFLKFALSCKRGYRS